MKKLLMIFFILCGYSFSQPHFQPVAPTGLPYIVVVDGATINGLEIAGGSEIGIFDGDLCVGSGIYNDSASIPITTWKGASDYGLEGFTDGDTIIFKIWTFWMNDSIEVVMNPVFSQGDGAFGWGTYSISTLSRVITGINDFQQSADEAKLLVYPNPSNGQVNIILTGVDTSQPFSLNIYSVTGKLIYSFNKMEMNLPDVILRWNGINQSGIKVSSGFYIIQYYNKSEIINKPIIYLK
jgi:hypothetical protein